MQKRCLNGALILIPAIRTVPLRRGVLIAVMERQKYVRSTKAVEGSAEALSSSLRHLTILP